MSQSSPTFNSDPKVEAYRFDPDPTVPNNPTLPLLVYRQVMRGSGDALAEAFEERYAANHWTPAWRWGVYGFHHYHAEAHEALGCFAGEATLRFGGEGGQTVRLRAGDLVVIPAGVGHKKLEATPDFQVSGAYPVGQACDMNRADSEVRGAIFERIASVPLPLADPVYGASGPLLSHWKPRAD